MTADFSAERIDLAREEDFRLGELLVRPSTRQIESNGKSETLQPRIMQVLVALARRRGQVVSRDELAETCWEGRAVGEDALNRCTQQIRKLGETSGAFRLETIPRVGYRLHAREGADAAGQDTTLDAQPKPVAWPRWLMPAAIAVAVVMLAAGAGWWINLNSRTVAIAAQPLTLAVLKFDSPADDAELEQFAAAVSRATADQLTRGGLNVVAPSQSMKLTGPAKADAADAFGAHALVDGNVSREGDGVRVGLRLDHAKAGITVWSSTLDGQLGEPAAIAQRLSAQLLQKLSLYGPAGQLVLPQREAAERARAWFRVIQLSDEGDDRASMLASNDFVRLWPNHASPLFMQTIETMDALHSLSDEDRFRAFKVAHDAAQEALRLGNSDAKQGPANAVAETIPAYAWGERITAFETIYVDGRPASPTTDYLNTGRVSLALEKMGAGPINGKTGLIRRAEAFLARGERTPAADDLDSGTFIYPLHPRFPELRFESAAWMGSPEEAEPLLDEPGAWRVTDVEREVLSKFLLARRTPTAGNIRAVADHCALPATRRADTALLYCFSALTVLGRVDAAFIVAETLFPELRPQPGDDPETPRWLAAPEVAWEPIVLYMPWTAKLRTDPRVIGVFDRLGLLDYWRASGEWPDFCEIEPAAAQVCTQMKSGQPI